MAKCQCCKQSSRLRKVECVCGTYAMQSRSMIRNGLLSCHCGGTLEPVCLVDRAELCDDREAWAEYAHRFPGRPDPQLSAWAKKGAQTRKARKAYAAVRVATVPEMPF